MCEVIKYIFGQDLISIHQSALIKRLAEIDDVILVVESTHDSDRAKENWDFPSVEQLCGWDSSIYLH